MSAIEIAGPSGVGKSTVAAATRLETNPRVSLDDALRHLKDDPATAAFRELLETAFRTARGDRVEQRRSFLYRTLWRLIFIRQRRQSAPVLLDGGLVRRGHGFDAMRSDVPVEDYYRLMPAADLTVFLLAEPEIIVARNRARGGDHDRSDEVARAMELDAMARRILTERGERVEMLDAMAPAEDNARLIRCWSIPGLS